MLKALEKSRIRTFVFYDCLKILQESQRLGVAQDVVFIKLCHMA